MDLGELRKRGDTAYYTHLEGEKVRLVELGQGRFVTIVPGELRLFGVPNEGLDLVFRVDEVQPGRVRPTAIRLESPGGREVTATEWREVNVQQLWREHLARMVMRKPEGERLREFERLSAEDKTRRMGEFFELGITLEPDRIELLRAKGPVLETLMLVASTYAFGESIGVPPAKLVQDQFTTQEQGELPRATATKWIRRARETGLLDDGGEDS